MRESGRPCKGGFLRQYADTSSPCMSFSPPPQPTLKLTGRLDINVCLKVPFDPAKVKPSHNPPPAPAPAPTPSANSVPGGSLCRKLSLLLKTQRNQKKGSMVGGGGGGVGASLSVYCRLTTWTSLSSILEPRLGKVLRRNELNHREQIGLTCFFFLSFFFFLKGNVCSCVTRGGEGGGVFILFHRERKQM